jgi:hypothetical protein
MPHHVIGLNVRERQELSEARIASLRRALVALRAAQGTPQIVPGEWDDEELERAALHVEGAIAAEATALPGVGGLRNPARFE